jgi:putative endonuclease
MPFYVYILKCADGSFYTGRTTDLSRRVYEHQTGADPKAYTFRRRPVHLVWSGEFEDKLEALTFEKQVKGWSRKKKQALIEGNWDKIHEIVSRERKAREGNK